MQIVSYQSIYFQIIYSVQNIQGNRSQLNFTLEWTSNEKKIFKHFIEFHRISMEKLKNLTINGAKHRKQLAKLYYVYNWLDHLAPYKMYWMLFHWENWEFHVLHIFDRWMCSHTFQWNSCKTKKKKKNWLVIQEIPRETKGESNLPWFGANNLINNRNCSSF